MLRTDVEEGEDVHDLAGALIQQAKRRTSAGLIDQAMIVLEQAWSIARIANPALADSAAWQLAWLAVRRNNFAEAATWLERVHSPPPLDGNWPQMREALIRVFRTVPAPTEEPATLPPLHVISLGRFVIVRDGVVLPACHARKAIAIFRYLLTRRFYTATKEELMELLWPEASPARAAHNLQVAISALRHHLDSTGRSYVLWENGSYRLVTAAIDADQRRFQDVCDSGDNAWAADHTELARKLYAEAVNRYVGDYYVDDADGMWAVTERERLLTRYLLALERLGDLQQAIAPAEAIMWYLRLVERDPFREDIFRHLMHCFWQMGRRGDALRQYQRLADTLRDELGLEPDQRTRALYQLIVHAE